ncbi:MAG: bifunctional 4-hydroxy-2-oxoglutarate aldolase/2-dehydro-3-deoxy-phosphogluconate aldolase [Chitinophagaceae bacterium]
MRKKEKILQVLLEQKLLPLYYHESKEVSIEILQVLYDAGVRIVEYTDRGEAALNNFKALRKVVDKKLPALQLGIGTIKSKKQAKKYIEAGADFIVCPIVNTEVAALASGAGLLWIPGCMTPTEIATAEEAGATLVKIFPGNILGSAYISAIMKLFPGLKFLPTGGVEAEENNLKSWFKAGAAVVGMGSKLITKEIVIQKDFNGLRINTQKVLQLVKEAAEH